MTDRMRHSVAKQEAFMRLMSSDPSLMGSLDDGLLASITLAAEPPRSRKATASSAAVPPAPASAPTTARHTLLDPRMSLRTNNSHRNSSSVRSSATPVKQKQVPVQPSNHVNVRLYSPDDVATPPSSSSSSTNRNVPKHVLLHSTSAPTSSTSKHDSRLRANAGTRDSSARPLQPLVSLLDASVFATHGDLKKKSSTKPPTAKASTAAVRQSPSRASPTSRTTNKRSPKANGRRRAQAPLVVLFPPSPPASTPVPKRRVTAEQQYEFSGLLDASPKDADALDQSVVESTHSSSNNSSNSTTNDSDDATALTRNIEASGHSNSGSSNSTSHIDLPPLPLSSSSSSSSSIRGARTAQLVLDHRCFVAIDQYVPKAARRSCSVCERDFNVLRKRHSCRMCGDVICSRCSVFRAVNLSVVENKCRICSCCSVSYRKRLEELLEKEMQSNSDVDATIVQSDAVPTATTAHSQEAPALSQLTASTLSTLLRQDAYLVTSAAVADTAADAEAAARCDSDLSTLLASDDARSASSASLSSISDLSFGSFSMSSSTASRNVEDELEAALRARQLEREVDASRSRIAELEHRIETHESQHELLSTEQQSELADARQVIRALQQQLQQQERSAMEAAATRDTLCLSNLRQTESLLTDDDERRALKKKLQVLERQLQLAGINVAEVIPYDVAKAKVAEIARRLQEIGASELVLDDKVAQAAARREYYKLEQDMEKYNTALVMTDEYIDEQRRQDAAFEAAQATANAAALAVVRSAIPVEISRLSEQQLRALATPTGATFLPVLAKRLKRTNALQLVRIDPQAITRMHPSVIEGFRTTGLSLLERRALHVVLATPAAAWKRQQMDDMSQKKLQWFLKLRDALVAAVASYSQHCATDAVVASDDGVEKEKTTATHTCKLLGLACPVRAEAKIEALYTAAPLGFPINDVFATQDVVKSEPDGAGEKALLEAQSYAREAVANARQQMLKRHYGAGGMRFVAQAIGALEEIDAALERLDGLDVSPPSPSASDASDCDAIVVAVRDLVLLLAKRAGICVVGKRSAARDELDTRSLLECRAAATAAAFVTSLLADVRQQLDRMAASGSTLGTLRTVLELLADVNEKNARASERLVDANAGADDAKTATGPSRKHRVAWSDRPVLNAATDTHAKRQGIATVNGATAAVRGPTETVATVVATSKSTPAVVAQPTSASLFDAIRARKQKQQQQSRAAASASVATTATSERIRNASTAPTAEKSTSPSSSNGTKAPVDLFAAIRARKARAEASASDASSNSNNTATPSTTTRSA